MDINLSQLRQGFDTVCEATNYLIDFGIQGNEDLLDGFLDTFGSYSEIFKEQSDLFLTAAETVHQIKQGEKTVEDLAQIVEQLHRTIFPYINSNLMRTSSDASTPSYLKVESESISVENQFFNCIGPIDKMHCFSDLKEKASPLVSIVLISYEHPELLELCVEAVFNYTAEVDYELIIVLNGTNEESIDFSKRLTYPKTKILNFSENVGAAFAREFGFSKAKGDYIVQLMGDIIVTKNWLSNLLKCIQSNARIGLAMPIMTNAMQHFDISKEFNTLYDTENVDNILDFAASYNISDPEKWEEVIWAVDPISIHSRECLNAIGKTALYYVHGNEINLCTKARMAGYKTVVCRDTIVHHYHDYTQRNSNQVLTSNPEDFEQFNFVEHLLGNLNNPKDLSPWYFSWQHKLIEAAEFTDLKDCVSVLGFDVLAGVSLLNLRYHIKRYGKAKRVTLRGMTTEPSYYRLLQTVCDAGVTCGSANDIFTEFPEEEKFDYIISDKYLNEYDNPIKLIDKLLALLKPKGQLLFNVKNTNNLNNILSVLLQKEKTMLNATMEKIFIHITLTGYECKNVRIDNIDEKGEEQSKKLLSAIDIVDNNLAVAKLCAVDYNFIVKKVLQPYSKINFEISAPDHSEPYQFVQINQFKEAVKHLKAKRIIDENTEIVLKNLTDTAFCPDFSKMADFLEKGNFKYQVESNCLDLPENITTGSLSGFTFILPDYFGLKKNCFHSFNMESDSKRIFQSVKRLRQNGYKGKVAIRAFLNKFNKQELLQLEKFALDNELSSDGPYVDWISDVYDCIDFLGRQMSFDEISDITGTLYVNKQTAKLAERPCDYKCPLISSELTVSANLQFKICGACNETLGSVFDLDIFKINGSKRGAEICKVCGKYGVDYLQNSLEACNLHD